MQMFHFARHSGAALIGVVAAAPLILRPASCAPASSTGGAREWRGAAVARLSTGLVTSAGDGGGGSLWMPVRHAATAGGSGSGGGAASVEGRTGSGASSSDGKRGKDGGGGQQGGKAGRKKTKIVKKLIRKPRAGGGSGGAGAASASHSGSSASSPSSTGATTGGHSSTAAPHHANTTGANATGSSSAAKNGSKATGTKKLLKKRRHATPTSSSRGSSHSHHGAAGGSHGGAHGSGTTSSGSGSGSSTGGGGGSVTAGAATVGAGSSVKAAGRKKKWKKMGKKKASTSSSASVAAAASVRRSGATGQKRRRGATAATAKATAKTSASRGGGGGARGASSGGKGRGKLKKLRVCVLNSSYDGADSATAAVDNFLCTPEHYARKDLKKYTFDDVSVKKIDSFRRVRELVTSGQYDVFFNLCDGGRDEKRAGVDVVQALEEMNAAFTGTDSRSFEPSKIDMKLLVGSCGVKVPNFVLLQDADSLAKKCRHLRFPVIVKHLSGYASVGIHKDNRCDDLDQLKKKVPLFVKEYNHALVEEFIRGREGTVLACADAASPHGVKVFKPLMFNFLKDGDDFAYFDKKWGMTCDDKAYGFLPHSDPAYGAIVEMARNAYKYIMNGVGYGRVDFRIDDRTGEPNFLEINPNCGMWYSEKDGGDFADIMVQGDANWDHERFLANAISRALKEQAARKPWYFISHDKSGHFSTRASRTVPAGKCLFGNAVHPIPVVSKSLYKLGAEDPSVGAVICRADGVHHAVAIRHSCEPNMQFVHGRTLIFAAKRQISVGEELTVDYATLRDENMPTFACSCGTQNCRSVIFAMPATARTLEVKAAKKLLREKKRVWLKERLAEREAERLLKKRSAVSTASSSASASHSAHGGHGGSGGVTVSGSGSGGASTASSAGSSSTSGGGASHSHK